MARETSPDGTKPINIVVLIDALGWEFIKNKHFLDDLLPYRNAVRTVLGFSSGAIPTLLTGVPPAETGHWNLFYYDPSGSPFRWFRPFLRLPDSILDSRIMSKLLKELGRRVLGLGPLFECAVSPRFLPWFNWVEKRNIYEPRGVSNTPSIFDRLVKNRVEYRVYSYHDATDARILKQVRRDLESTNTSFYFIYLSEMDMFLHTHCNNEIKLTEKLAWYEGELRELFRVARSTHRETHMTLLSDHGMTPIEHKYDLVSAIESLDLKLLSDYLAVYDSTMARFWFFNDRARREITECLSTVTCGKILSEAELKELGVWFSDGRFGQLVFLLEPRWLFAKSDFNGKGWQPAGMHGYHPSDPYSDAIFLSDQQPAAPVTTLAEVYPCLCAAAGVEP